MGSIQNGSHQPPTGGISSFRRLSYLRFVIMLFGGFSLINLGVTAFAQSTQPGLAFSNPFLEYNYAFPGQISPALNSEVFTCFETHTYNTLAEKSCSMNLASGIFSRIETSIYEGVIRQTTFTLRDNTLKIGDLALLFNAPNFHAYPRKVFFFWTKLFVIVSTTANGNHPSMRPVWNVTFTNTY